MQRRIILVLGLLGALALAPLGGGSRPAGAQGDAHRFAETGHTVDGLFWQYWQAHGGLAQQGYPISDEMQEKSDLNGQTYTVQYFERAVFEMHPENQPPYNVLLSQLGTVRYHAKYPNGAPGQQVSTTNPRAFAETGHTVGGVFRAYWEAHGGLAQQGYPISDEFTEVSDLDGKPYTVQYFERAVFERHPENAGTPFEVLLSQLGTFQHRAKYEVPPPPVPPTVPPAPAPTGTPPPSAGCGNVPAGVDATITPACGPVGTQYTLHIRGFDRGEIVDYRLLSPGRVTVTFLPEKVGSVNSSGELDVTFDSGLLRPPAVLHPEGQWSLIYHGRSSQHDAVAYFIVPGAGPDTGCGGIPANVNMEVRPDCGPGGTRFDYIAHGLAPNEQVGIYITAPDGSVLGAPFETHAGGGGDVSGVGVRTDVSTPPGIYAMTLEGKTSHIKAIGYFKLTSVQP